MGVTLYTSRVVLGALGVSDYGIYNVVGGIVAMMAFLNSAMATATQRYLSYDIGRNNPLQLQKTFSATLTVHYFIAFLIFVVGETIGLWYINYKMNYPIERTFAVNVVFQFSLFTLFLDIIQVPYNALILARERMNVYAYVSILEAVLKLLVAYLLLWYGMDKLILYSILTFCLVFIIRNIYKFYCKRNFQESKFKFEYDRQYLVELVSFSGWNLFGTMSLVFKNQGINMVLNLFYGTFVNAAYGIAMQLQGAVNQFVSNFQVA
ncbi:MAG: MATE family efflux transporter, partial [Sphingobacterium sp.]